MVPEGGVHLRLDGAVLGVDAELDEAELAVEGVDREEDGGGPLRMSKTRMATLSQSSSKKKRQRMVGMWSPL